MIITLKKYPVPIVSAEIDLYTYIHLQQSGQGNSMQKESFQINGA